MTVAELIAELQKLPQDLPVCVGEYEISELRRWTGGYWRYVPRSLQAGASLKADVGSFVELT